MRYLVLALLLAGCATQEEIARKNAEWMVNTYGPTCTAAGFDQETPEWSNCVVSLYGNDRSNAAANSAALMGAGLGLMQMNRPYTVPVPQPALPTYTNCYETSYGIQCRTQ